MDLKQKIREINDFPIPGIVFRDITTVLKEADVLKFAVDKMAEMLSGIEFDAFIAPESRGFIFGMPLSYKLGKGFIPVRKSGKLPAETARKEYELEYGSAVIEIHKDAIEAGKKYVLVDDLLATGGTARAAAELVEELGGIALSNLFFIELSGLGGREFMNGRDVRSLLIYE
ncbi:MAG: adenine phosphoribosyltransferase [Defluviitaleaceae bacterium]|nr:adenine phosphoribosyltransferase [Defluviitaleaceae bacterium]